MKESQKRQSFLIPAEHLVCESPSSASDQRRQRIRSMPLTCSAISHHYLCRFESTTNSQLYSTLSWAAYPTFRLFGIAAAWKNSFNSFWLTSAKNRKFALVSQNELNEF